MWIFLLQIQFNTNQGFYPDLSSNPSVHYSLTDACNPSSFQCTQIAINAAEAHADGQKALSDADLAISAAADKVCTVDLYMLVVAGVLHLYCSIILSQS